MFVFIPNLLYIPLAQPNLDIVRLADHCKETHVKYAGKHSRAVGH